MRKPDIAKIPLRPLQIKKALTESPANLGASRTPIDSSQTLNYSAIGATLRSATETHPPEGFVFTTFSVRMGRQSGDFERVENWLFDWGLQRDIGDVVAVDASSPGIRYQGVGFDGQGVPIVPAQVLVATQESIKTTKVQIGTAVTLAASSPLRAISGRRIVVETVDDPARKGYAIGTCGGTSWRCEEFIAVERRPDNSVFVTIATLTHLGEGLEIYRNLILRYLRSRMYRKALRHFASKHH